MLFTLQQRHTIQQSKAAHIEGARNGRIIGQGDRGFKVLPEPVVAARVVAGCGFGFVGLSAQHIVNIRMII